MQALVDKITALFERDQARGHKARIAEDIPISYEAITTEWLTAILCADAPRATVMSFTLDERDDGTSNRRRIFLEYNQTGEDTALPRSVFCKAAHSLSSRILLGISGGAHAETAFFAKARPCLDIRAPEAYYARYDPNSFAMMVVLRDMAGEVEFCNEHTKMDLRRAESQIDLLARLHAKFYGSPELGTPSLNFESWPKFWANLGRIGLQQASDNGFKAAESVVPPGLFPRWQEIWPAAMRSVEFQARRPIMLSHSDPHLKNWYISKSGEMGLGDWQAVVGSGFRDVAYTLSTALEIEDRRSWECGLLRRYIERMREYAGADIGFDEAWLAYRRELFTSLTFWTGTLTPQESLPAMQPVGTSLKFIQRITHAIDDLEALDAFSSV